MKILLLLIVPLGLLAGCDETHVDQKSSVSRTQVGTFLDVRTIEHDSHKFVVVSTGSYDGGACVVHHPGCPCLKSETLK